MRFIKTKGLILTLQPTAALFGINVIHQNAIFTGRRLHSIAKSVCVCLIMLQAGMLSAEPGTKPVEIINVVDGDTIKVLLAGRKENIRMIGIDTPESKANSKARKDAKRTGSDIKKILSLGKAASGYTKSIVKPGDIVYIELDIEPRDHYGRILAYIYLKSGEMLNEKIIADGYGSVMTIPPNIRYQARFLNAYKTARDREIGLWAATNTISPSKTILLPAPAKPLPENFR